MIEFPKTPLPAHVPAELVRPFPFIFGLTTDRDPFNELAAEVHKQPEIFYAEHAYPGGTPAWILRRAEDLRNLYLDTEHFSAKDFSPFAKIIGETWNVLPVEFDPPEHSVYRALIAPLFTPQAMARLDERIRGYALEYILGFKDRGECEFMKDFSFEFPIKVFMELMGLPQSMTHTFMDWEMNLLYNHDLNKMAEAVRNVTTYLREQLEDRRQSPTGDLISFAVQAEINGRPLTEDELVGFTFNLFIGGLDTVSTHMGLHFLHLGRHLDHQRQLRANPSLIPAAVEELMRAYPGVTTFRTCKKATEIKGVKFMPGDKVAMMTTLSGRDPQEYDNPGEIRLDRKPRHNSFGFGAHHCVGIHLARREMRIAMEEFLANIPEFRLAEGFSPSYHMGMIQPLAVPLRW